MEGRTDALVSYRNRVQELCVPSIDSLPGLEHRRDVAARRNG